MSQSQFEKLLEDSFTEYERSFERQIGRVRNRSLDQARIELFTLISDHAREGKIDSRSVTEIVRKLDRMERLIYQGLNEEMERSIQTSATQASEHLNTAIITVLSMPALLELHGINSAVSSGGLAEQVLTSNTGFLLGIGSLLPEFVDAITQSTYNRKSDDGKAIRDRLRDLAKVIRKEVARELRKQVNKDIPNVQKALNKVFKDNNWKIDRLTETESMFAYRQAIAKASEQNPDLVIGLRIKDFTHGDPAVHRRHKCYIYAHRDEHGMGQGVYPVGTRKIKNPHPQCRSILLPVLNTELLS